MASRWETVTVGRRHLLLVWDGFKDQPTWIHVTLGVASSSLFELLSHYRSFYYFDKPQRVSTETKRPFPQPQTFCKKYLIGGPSFWIPHNFRRVLHKHHSSQISQCIDFCKLHFVFLTPGVNSAEEKNRWAPETFQALWSSWNLSHWLGMTRAVFAPPESLGEQLTCCLS